MPAKPRLMRWDFLPRERHCASFPMLFLWSATTIRFEYSGAVESKEKI